MIYTVTLNPAVDKIARLNEIKVNELNRVSKIETDAGGKGINVSRTIKCLQSSSIAVGFLGGSTGSFVDCLLQREDIDAHMVGIIGNTRTNLKIMDGDNQLTEFNEEGPFILQNEFDELLDYLRNQLDSNSVLVISGSMPKGLSRSTYTQLIELAKDAGSTVLLDTTLTLFKDAKEACPQIVKLAEADLASYYHIDEVLSEELKITLLKRLISEGIEIAILIDSHSDAYVASASHVYKCHAQNVEVKTMIGAADSFIAGFVVGLEKKYEMIDLLKLACGCFVAASLSKNARPTDLHSVNEHERDTLVEILD